MSVRLRVEELDDTLDDVGAIEPGDVTGIVEQQELGLAAEGVGVGPGEVRPDVRILLAPDDERRGVEPAELGTGRGETLG